MALQARVGWRAYTPSSTLLLDTYGGAHTAFSMFKLRTTYSGNCIRVRRSSDNAEQDIGFVNNYLDTSSLLSFVGGGNGFVVRWYDQSTNVRNLTQTTAANQPQIVSSGSLITRNGKAVISATSSQQLRLETGPVFTTSYSWWLSYEKDTTGNQAILGRDSVNVLYLDYGTSQYIANTNANPITTTALSINTFRLINGIYQFPNTNFTANLFINGTSRGTASGTATIGSTRAGFQVVPYINSAFRTAKVFFNEFVIWTTDQTSNRTSIESNINTRNTIY
jgi:hypothetical protein